VGSPAAISSAKLGPVSAATRAPGQARAISWLGRSPVFPVDSLPAAHQRPPVERRPVLAEEPAERLGRNSEEDAVRPRSARGRSSHAPKAAGPRPAAARGSRACAASPRPDPNHGSRARPSAPRAPASRRAPCRTPLRRGSQLRSCLRALPACAQERRLRGVERPARPRHQVEAVGQAQIQPLDSRPGDHRAIVSAERERRGHEGHTRFA
jgi:hypothetical protein